MSSVIPSLDAEIIVVVGCHAKEWLSRARRPADPVLPRAAAALAVAHVIALHARSQCRVAADPVDKSHAIRRIVGVDSDASGGGVQIDLDLMYLMGLLLIEMVAHYGAPLEELVEDLLKEAGPSYYARIDQRLSHPVSKAEMVKRLSEDAPNSIGGAIVTNVNTTDGVKYMMKDDAWLLIRPSGTEPVLRIYAEAREQAMVDALLEHGKSVAGQP